MFQCYCEETIDDRFLDFSIFTFPLLKAAICSLYSTFLKRILFFLARSWLVEILSIAISLQNSSLCGINIGFSDKQRLTCAERDKLAEGLGYRCLHGVGFFKLLHIRPFIQVMVIWGVHVIFLARIWFQYIMLYYSKLNLYKIGIWE